MLWDIFCKVIDNHGDIGVCWRLACNLARRGAAVRLWVDDPAALAWMAPHGYPQVDVGRWYDGRSFPRPGDAVVEAFGCELPADFVAAMASRIRPPHWINLEYLSAEDFAGRAHGLPSPVLSGPGAGLTKHFFYPGFTASTGGLLREPELMHRRAAFDRQAWLAGIGVWSAGARVVSLFCYEPPALAELLLQLALAPQATRLLVTAGRATAAVQQHLNLAPAPLGGGAARSLSITYLPLLTQLDYDALLWACDFNFVRGEDSMVRALWAGQPFAWQIYPQDDGAHEPKLEAFLACIDASESLRRFHRAWNGLAPDLPVLDLAGWAPAVRLARERLLSQDDLVTQLLRFVADQERRQGANRSSSRL